MKCPNLLVEITLFQGDINHGQKTQGCILKEEKGKTLKIEETIYE